MHASRHRAPMSGTLAAKTQTLVDVFGRLPGDRAGDASHSLRPPCQNRFHLDAVRFAGNFDYCHLGIANLRNADFTAARCTHGNFQHADLRGAVFHRAIITGALFEGAHLESAAFNGSVGLSIEEIRKAHCWSTSPGSNEPQWADLPQQAHK